MLRFPKAFAAIKSPQLAPRQHAKLILSNGIKVCLVSDPKTPSAAAAVCVDSGSWSDEISHQGTAHFLEHMLFLGSKSFPVENDFDRFIKVRYESG
jgi:secreted Zn-dependent insulinase-like peptidase